MNSIGIDFGTTNTVLAFPERGGGARVQTFSRGGDSLDAVRTALSFKRSARQGDAPVANVGPWAIDEFIESPEDTRFLQSFKSFAASPSLPMKIVYCRLLITFR